MKRTILILAVGTTAALVAACTSSSTTSSTSGPSAASASSSASPAAGRGSAPRSSAAAIISAPRSATAAAGPVLSGRWKGNYDGAYSGTFVLRWAQSASRLSGTIDLSTAPGAVDINGTVAGGRIEFGTVGSEAITYTGSVSGSSMTGHYEIAGGAGGSGTWSATRG